jgi:hypothetical protein
MVYVLNVLSEVAPDWIRAHVPDEWVERYGQRLEEEREPSEEQERQQYANQVGADGWLLLEALESANTPDWMKTLPAVATLRTMWEQQFEPREQGGSFRREPALPAAQLLTSPYDLDARNGKKRATFWTGYKVHFTQTCDEDTPQLITHVETTPAPLSDEGVLSAIHTDLAEQDLLPEQHLVDSGYVTIANLVTSRSDHEVDLVGPTLKTHWYQAETGYDLTHFSIDWEAEEVTCPQGRISSSWTPVEDAGKSLIKVKFSASAIVKSVPRGTPVREPRAARSPCTQRSRCRRCLLRASGRRPLSSRRSIAIGQALKAPILKPCVRWVYVAPAIWVCTRPTWAMWLWLPRSISFN